jgi:hypothetical protein
MFRSDDTGKIYDMSKVVWIKNVSCQIRPGYEYHEETVWKFGWTRKIHIPAGYYETIELKMCYRAEIAPPLVPKEAAVYGEWTALIRFSGVEKIKEWGNGFYSAFKDVYVAIGIPEHMIPQQKDEEASEKIVVASQKDEKASGT